MIPLNGPEIRRFIEEHLHDDIHELALKHSDVGGIPIRDIIDQIVSRNKAVGKLPSWFDQSHLIFPPPVSIEQASSELTASFKSETFQGEKVLDLTGGVGVDSYYLSKSFRRVILVEKDEKLIDLARHNLKVLGAVNVDCICKTAEEYLQICNEDFDLIYVDPSRRLKGKKVFKLKDSSPDVLEILDNLREKGSQILIKTSPLLDIQKSLNDLQSVIRVIVVSVKNETREVLYLLDRKFDVMDPEIETINILPGESGTHHQKFRFKFAEEHKTFPEYAAPLLSHFIYEPNSSILKAGAFKTVAKRYGLNKFHPNTHLYSSQKHIEKFPGRIFQVKNIFKGVSHARKELKGSRLNITVRNFPIRPLELTEKIKCFDGGENFLIAARVSFGEGRLFLCDRLA